MAITVPSNMFFAATAQTVGITRINRARTVELGRVHRTRRGGRQTATISDSARVLPIELMGAHCSWGAGATRVTHIELQRP